MNLSVTRNEANLQYSWSLWTMKMSRVRQRLFMLQTTISKEGQ